MNTTGNTIFVKGGATGIAKMLLVALFGLSFNVFAESSSPNYFPLEKDEVLKKGWRWREQRDEMPEVSRVIPASKLPHSINDIPDDILDWAIECEETKRPFRIVKKELVLEPEGRAELG